MTKREMFEAIVNGNITEEVIAMAQKELNRGAEARAAKTAEQNETDTAVIDALEQATAYVPASEIAETAGLTVGKVTASLKRLRVAEKVLVIEGKPNTYKLA